MLTIYIDFKSPASYLAIKPVLSLAERNDIALEWKPYQTFEREPPTITDNASVGQTHRRVRAASRRAIHQKYAALQGIDLQFPEAAGDTDLALGALASIGDDPLPFINAGFAVYWSDHADLNDPAIVAPLMAETIGGDLSFDEHSVRDACMSAQAEAEERGIVEAPAFFIQDQLFIGREHLPWIEEIIRANY